MTLDQPLVEVAPLGTRLYRNPLGYADGVPRTDPDPFVMRFRGRYYCYSTHQQQVNVSVSDDMITWHRVGAALIVDGREHYWAPCVYYHDGVFHMYVSNRPAGSDDPHEEVLQLATSSSPEGPFSVVHQFFDTFSIDPHVVPDGSGGWVMFYSVNDVTGLDDAYTGTSIVADRMLTLDSLEGRPRTIVKPTLDEEIFERNRFGDGRDWYTIEGATYFTRNGRAYLTYSGNAYEREDYFIGYASAPLTGAPHELEWTKHPDEHTWAPLVRRSHAVEGTGHNSIVRAPNLIDDWIVYHGRDADQELTQGVEQRVMRIDPIRYQGHELRTDAPTAVPQSAPSLPTLFDRFESAVIGTGWEASGDGRFAPSTDGVVSGDGRAFLVNEHQTDAYVAEVWMAAERSDRGSRAGVVVAWTDELNFTEALVDAASNRLIVRTWSAGLGVDVAAQELPAMTPSAWQTLRIGRTYGRASVAVGDLTPLEFAVPTGEARVGITTVRTTARFAAFTLTDHVALRGRALAGPGTPFACVPALCADERGIATPGKSSAVLSASRPLDNVTVYELDLLSPISKAVLVPWESAGTQIRVEVSRTRVEATLSIDGVRRAGVQHERDGRSSATVQVTQLGDGVLLQSDAWSHRFTIPTAGTPTQRIELTGSRLVAYEQTALSPSQPLAKEHA